MTNQERIAKALWENATIEARAEANSRMAMFLGALDGESAEDAAGRVISERDVAREALAKVEAQW